MVPESGDIFLNGKPLTENASDIGYMLQHDHLFEWRTVYRNVLLGAETNHMLNEETRKKADTLLEQVRAEAIRTRQTFTALRRNAPAGRSDPYSGAGTGSSSFR